MENRYLLLVEGNRDDVYLTLRGLQRSGFDLPLHVVGDPTEALEFLESTPELPAAVLVSYRLPRMTGLEFINRMRKNESIAQLPALLMLGSTDERDHVCGVDCTTGADACLVKPIESDELAQMLVRLKAMRPLQAAAQ